MSFSPSTTSPTTPSGKRTRCNSTIAGLIHSDVGSDNTYVEAVEDRAISLIDNIQDLSDKLDYLRGEEPA